MLTLLQATAMFTFIVGIVFLISYFGRQGLDERYGQTGEHPKQLSYLERGNYEKAKAAWSMSRVLLPALLVILVIELIVYGVMSWFG